MDAARFSCRPCGVVLGCPFLLGLLMGGIGGLLVDADHLWPGGRSLHPAFMLLGGIVVACYWGLFLLRVLGD